MLRRWDRRECVALSLLFACALAPLAECADLVPSVTIHGVQPAQVGEELVARCIRNGASVSQSSASQVVCSRPFPDNLAAYAFRALGTPNNSTNPVMYARYNFARTATGTIVGADFYYEFETAFGQRNTQPIDAPKILKEAQSNLEKLKADLESKAAPARAQPEEASRAMASDPDAYWDTAQRMAAASNCLAGFVQVAKDSGREVFRADCPDGSRVEIECWTGICQAL